MLLPHYLELDRCTIELTQERSLNCWNKRRDKKNSEFAFDLGELVRQTDSVHTSNVSYLYLNRIKGKIMNEMNGNYNREWTVPCSETARARNSHSNFPTLILTKVLPIWVMIYRTKKKLCEPFYGQRSTNTIASEYRIPPTGITGIWECWRGGGLTCLSLMTDMRNCPAKWVYSFVAPIRGQGDDARYFVSLAFHASPHWPRSVSPFSNLKRNANGLRTRKDSESIGSPPKTLPGDMLSMANQI